MVTWYRFTFAFCRKRDYVNSSQLDNFSFLISSQPSIEDLSHSFFYHKFITKETASVRMEIRIKSDVILLIVFLEYFFLGPALIGHFHADDI